MSLCSALVEVVSFPDLVWEQDLASNPGAEEGLGFSPSSAPGFETKQDRAGCKGIMKACHALEAEMVRSAFTGHTHNSDWHKLCQLALI